MLRARLMLILLVCGLITNGQDDMIWKTGTSNNACINFFNEPPILTYLNKDSVKLWLYSDLSVYDHLSKNLCLFSNQPQDINGIPILGATYLFDKDIQIVANISGVPIHGWSSNNGFWQNDSIIILFTTTHNEITSPIAKIYFLKLKLVNNQICIFDVDTTSHLWGLNNLKVLTNFKTFTSKLNRSAYFLSFDTINFDSTRVLVRKMFFDDQLKIQYKIILDYIIENKGLNYFDTRWIEFVLSEDERRVIIVNSKDGPKSALFENILFFNNNDLNEWSHKDMRLPSEFWLSSPPQYNNLFLDKESNILYLPVYDGSKNLKPNHEKTILFKFNLNNSDIWSSRREIISDKKERSFPITIRYIKLGPNGKLYASDLQSLYEIINWNKWEDTSYLVEVSLKDSFGNPYTRYNNANQYLHIHFPNTLGIYRKAKFESFPTCKGLEMAFYNTSDTQHWTHYKLYFGDGDTVALSKDDFPLQSELLPHLRKAITHAYPKPGRYFMKLQAFNKMGFVWYSDSITIHPPPVAGFTVSDTAGCQWIAHHFKNTSSFKPRFLGPPPAAYAYHWQFGNGIDTTMYFAAMPTAAQGSVSHTYTQNGLYRVSLVANDGFCTDTFTLNQQVNILPAPRPGINLAPSDSGCSPLQVQVSRLWSDPIDSAHWQFGDGNVRTVLVNPATAVHTYNHTLSTQQKYLLKQRLFGPTGCITEDSLLVSVLPGFENGYTPILDFASVNPDQSVMVSWQPHAHAAQYQVYKNNAPLALSVNANFTDPNYTAQASYQVSAINACAQPSPHSNIGKLMLLQGQNQNNQSALLQWTAYEDWSAASGILHYQLEVNQNGQFVPITQTTDLDHTDAEFIQSGQYERCYRVTAVQTANPAIQSHSNTACVGYEAVIFVPNAFSPNDDGLNDLFEPFNIGFKHYTLKVYNRWGEKIAEGRSWDGKIQGVPAPVGLYHFQIEGKTGKSENTFLKGEVMLTK